MTSSSTIDAILYELRGGLSALNDAGCLDRLQRCDKEAMEVIVAELLMWPKSGRVRNAANSDKVLPWLPRWSEENIAKLIMIRKGLQ